MFFLAVESQNTTQFGILILPSWVPDCMIWRDCFRWLSINLFLPNSSFSNLQVFDPWILDSKTRLLSRFEWILFDFDQICSFFKFSTRISKDFESSFIKIKWHLLFILISLNFILSFVVWQEQGVNRDLWRLARLWKIVNNSSFAHSVRAFSMCLKTKFKQKIGSRSSFKRSSLF
jgi:hypothetical protein